VRVYDGHVSAVNVARGAEVYLSAATLPKLLTVTRALLRKGAKVRLPPAAPVTVHGSRVYRPHNRIIGGARVTGYVGDWYVSVETHCGDVTGSAARYRLACAAMRRGLQRLAKFEAALAAKLEG
jgi:hypothetical protein